MFSSETPLRRKLPAVALAAGIGVGALTACDMPDSEQATNWKPVVATYKGKDIYCRAWDTGSAKNGYDCDFVGYYAGNPNPPAHATRLADGILHLIPSSYNGKPLDCLMYDAYRKEDGQTCDWVAYHKQNDTAPFPSPSVTATPSAVMPS